MPKVTSVFSTADENESKFSKKFRENPFFPIGIVGCIGAVTYGFWNIKKRGNLPLSLYLIHMRVGAQGMVVGTLALGVTYGLGKRLYNMANGIDTWEQEHGKDKPRDPDGR